MKQQHERKVVGDMNTWFPAMGLVQNMLTWLSVPAEVFLRRDFGERWFTITNFYAGFFALFCFAILEKLRFLFGGLISNSPLNFGKDVQVSSPVLSFWDNALQWLLVVYVVLGIWHFFKIWWRNRILEPLHSLDEGTSRLLPLAPLVMGLVNVAAMPFLRLLMILLPQRERSKLDALGGGTPLLIADRRVFTDCLLEPMFMLFLAFLTQNMVSLWLLVSAFSLAASAARREEQRKHVWLDMQDIAIDAEIEQQNRKFSKEQQQKKQEASSVKERVLKQVEVITERTPETLPKIQEDIPDLMSIISEFHDAKRT